MLSNTAVPKYYGQFRDAVIRGDIPVNENVSMQMNRIDDDIANPAYYYDGDKVEGWIAFCEDEMTLIDGSDVTVLFTFRLWAEDLLGWYEYVERNVYDPNVGDFVPKRIKVRLRHKQFIILGRGGAKTLYESWMQAYGLVVDTSTTNQVTTAPTMKQAEEVTTPINTALTRSKGPVLQFLTDGSLQNTTGDRANRQKLASTKKGIQNFLTNSILEIRPMTIDKLQGLRTKYNTIDEWLSGDIREDVVGPLEQGAKKILNWWILAVSSEGTVRNGPGDDIKMELTSILRGEYYNPHVSIWWYRLDSIEEMNDPKMWVKAQPNLGYTVSYEDYLEEVRGYVEDEYIPALYRGNRCTEEEMDALAEKYLKNDDIVIMTGSLTGLLGPCTNRYGIYCGNGKNAPKGSLAGFFGAELKLCGYDGMIIRGKAKSPVYITIQDAVIKFRSASALAGKNVDAKTAAIAGKFPLRVCSSHRRQALQRSGGIRRCIRS